MSRLNPFALPVLARMARPSPTLATGLRSQFSAPPRSLSSRVYSQAAPHLRTPARNLHAGFRARTPFAQAARRGFRTSARRASKDAPKAEEQLSFGARMKKLTKEYGWVTVGVYLGLSVIDLPFCFLLVRVVGTDRIGELEHMVTSNVGQFIPESVQTTYSNTRDAVKGFLSRFYSSEESDKGAAAEAAGEVAGEVANDWGVKEAQEARRNEAGLVTQLALAYAIHKSFIFIRVPLTAAVTPKVVKVLRSWGWQIGKKKPKA